MFTASSASLVKSKDEQTHRKSHKSLRRIDGFGSGDPYPYIRGHPFLCVLCDLCVDRLFGSDFYTQRSQRSRRRIRFGYPLIRGHPFFVFFAISM
jgi:hypothetical protein